ncbi:GNAT family N-acetyltransferase [Desulfovibrio mangrovi]|uniref:GNAT family N-acetyltransferase n=1 Tax=Desulfovibrio mangrovi TaxID=2976983 RepID=UPI002246D66E|nr:GNAT family N-acetyltransferase [Desulfovibrio mangrovi]UZP66050.1 GNAT family N-acetyltransferase [Desulfovibrio mangrovi]
MITRTQFLKGAELLPHLDSIANLRIRIFREYPYLYSGEERYELEYLKVYAESANAFAILAWHGEHVAGAVTGIPLQDEMEDFRACFAGTEYSLNEVYYVGELLFHPEFRSGGHGTALLELAEQHVRTMPQFRYLTCATVVRPPDHPLQPEGYVPIDRFLLRNAFLRMEGVTANLAWPELDGVSVDHVMQFWIKAL